MPTMSARDFLSQLNEDVTQEKAAKENTVKENKANENNTIYKIVDDLPLPETKKGSKYPFAQLEVGQAFIIPADAVPSKGLPCVRAAAAAYRKRSGEKVKLTARMLEDGSVGVWRLA